MTAIIIRRLIAAIPVLFIIVSLTFVLMHNAPGSPFSTERHIPAPILAELEKKYHLHGSFGQQYGEYLGDLMHGDLGLSTQYRNRTVNEIIAQSLPVSMVLGSLAYVMALVVGITLGALAAVRHHRAGDRVIVLAALLGISIPNFVLAILVIRLLAIDLHLLPIAGWGSLGQLVLPAMCLSVPFIASLTRITAAACWMSCGSTSSARRGRRDCRNRPCFSAMRSRSRCCRSSATAVRPSPAS